MALGVHVAAAGADLQQGDAIGYTCMGCHGIDGYRNAYPSYRVPKLGGQKREYIETALRAYRDGSRVHPTMQAQAGSLTDADIENVAAWLEQFGTVADEATAESVAGFEAAALCVTCHGQEGAAVEPTPPTLSGQHEDYFIKAMQQYRDGTRSGSIMGGFVTTLSDQDVERLARFYASQGGLHTPELDD